jgi:serine/threonine-protein kinase
MGIVHVAHDETLGRKVALKLLAPVLADNIAFRDRFVRESRLAASIDHPNIIPVYEAGDDAGTLFIAMRLVRGLDLRQLLAAEGPLHPDRTVAIGAQVAGALDAAHGVGLVHRDVKPGNAMLDVAGGHEHCYLTDFGLTKDLSSSSGFTVTGEPIGTLKYMAPEQVDGRRLDGRADQYALGCVLFECLTGSAPFVRDSHVALMYAHMHEPPPSACAARPELPAGVDSVLARAMAKAADDRYPSCAAAVAGLGEALAGSPVPAFHPTRRTSRRFSRPAPAEPAVVAPVEAPATPPPSVATPPRARHPNGNGHTPPTLRPPTSPPPYHVPPQSGDGDESRWMRAAAILACAILLCAGGIAAALILRDGGGSSGAKKTAAEDLLQRTIQLNNELNREAKLLLHQDARADAATRRRVADLQKRADILLTDARRELDEASDTRNALIAAHLKMKRATGDMVEIGRSGGSAQTKRHMRGQLGGVPGDLSDAQDSLDNEPKVPPVHTPTPVGGAGVKADGVTLPDGALATITPETGRKVMSIESVGDVNGDRISDVALSVSSGDGASTGYIIFGGDGGDVGLGSLGKRGIQIENAWQVGSAGDVNGDGRDDVAVIGAPDIATPVGFVIYGQRVPGKVDLAHLGPEGRTIELPDGGTGDEADFLENVSWALRSAGDVNDDGYGDVIFGEPSASAGDGSAWVIFGGPSGLPVSLTALDSSEGFAITGESAAGLGAWVSGAGDMNGDAIDDVIVGAPYSGDVGQGGGHHAGMAYVVFGSSEPHDTDVANLDGDGFAISSQEYYAHLGAAAVALDDVNDDGFGDVLVSAPGAGFDSDQRGAGAAYVVYGAEHPKDVQVGELGSDGYTIKSPAAPKPFKEELSGGLGLTAAPVGDFDGDGKTDVILTAPGLRAPAAAAYVVLTGAGSDDIDLAEPGPRAVAIERDGKPSINRPLVAGGFDFDGDNHPDVVFSPDGWADDQPPTYVISGGR